MNNRKRKGLWLIGIGVAILLIAGIAQWTGNRAPAISNFAECASAGNPVMESYPRQCKTSNGTVFREDIGNELEKDNLIRIAEPRPNASIVSPLTVKGVARGGWFFEASFPVRLVDSSGNEIAVGVAHTKENWMTAEFVPFETTLTFEKSSTDTGELLLQNDNPSGLPEYEDALRVPVRFR